MARYSDLKADKVRSYLSNKVYHILCEAGIRTEGVTENILDDKGLLNWTTISSCLPEHTTDCYEYFVHSAKGLAVIFKASYQHLASLTAEQFSKLYGQWLEWTSIPKALLHCFELLKEGDETKPLESLLLSCTILERSLGDVFLLRGNQCPSMLKDLLVTPQLRAIFGDTVIQLLRVLIGPSISLNIRNVAWHGFPSPGEISPRYGMFILHVSASLGSLLEQQGIRPADIKHRPFVNLSSVHKLRFAFFDISSDTHSALMTLHETSSFVSPQMLPFWSRALQLYAEQRYDLCVMLLLPQIEQALRCVFCVANDCQARVLTAENNVLYTTFDEILHHKLEDGSPNQLRHYIGDNHVTMLLDLLMYPEGPRIRDRLSHGECDLLFDDPEVRHSGCATPLMDSQTTHSNDLRYINDSKSSFSNCTCSANSHRKSMCSKNSHFNCLNPSIISEKSEKDCFIHSKETDMSKSVLSVQSEIANSDYVLPPTESAHFRTSEAAPTEFHQQSTTKEMCGAKEYSDIVKLWKQIANHVVGMTSAFCLLFLPNDDLVNSHSYLEMIFTGAQSYSSTFHPLSLLQSELIESAELLAIWRDVARPSAHEMVISNAWNTEEIECKIGNDCLLAAGRALMLRCAGQMSQYDLCTFLQPFAHTVELLSTHTFEFDTLYRYKTDLQSEKSPQNEHLDKSGVSNEEQIVGLLRRILSLSRVISKQVAELCTVRYQQWKEKSLRSRQRNTYQRMLNTIPVLSSGMKLVFLLTVSLLYKIQDSQNWTKEQQLTDIKFLKSVLQYTENVATYTSADKNRWEEAEKLTLQLYEKCAKLK